MKKLGLLFFIAALIIGSFLANSTDSGRFGIGSFLFSRVQGSGVLLTEKRELSGFDRIDGSNSINVEIAIGGDFSVEVEADDNLLPYIKTEVENGGLKIYSTGRISRVNPVNVRISMPAIEGLKISGASKANLTDVAGENIELKANGASRIVVSGAVRKLQTSANGASSIEAENLRAENAEVKANGASRMTIFATEMLSAKANGASRISYIGEPAVLNKKSNGASSIVQK